jgi:hypothetical protein
LAALCVRVECFGGSGARRVAYRDPDPGPALAFMDATKKMARKPALALID